ncbi:hypothetical protein [Bacillus sp. UNCCL13]|uniref:hypothetical protein n=1 Tax=Bacillus sp. UNCCL13 TaxID=1502772 RepID=UPI001C31C0B5|nr:hypothetical protein [Bacillus sp. UNCCL13]
MIFSLQSRRGLATACLFQNVAYLILTPDVESFKHELFARESRKSKAFPVQII